MTDAERVERRCLIELDMTADEAFERDPGAYTRIAVDELGR